MDKATEAIIRATLEATVALHERGDHEAAAMGVRFLLITLGAPAPQPVRVNVCDVDPFEAFEEDEHVDF